MRQFPDLNDDQVAIMRADSLTGHVLDESFLLAVDDCQTVYTIADSLEDAIGIVDDLKAKNANVEFVIYGKDEVVLKFIQ
jgi:hypothetical protein